MRRQSSVVSRHMNTYVRRRKKNDLSTIHVENMLIWYTNESKCAMRQTHSIHIRWFKRFSGHPSLTIDIFECALFFTYKINRIFCWQPDQEESVLKSWIWIKDKHEIPFCWTSRSKPNPHFCKQSMSTKKIHCRFVCASILDTLCHEYVLMCVCVCKYSIRNGFVYLTLKLLWMK